MQRLRFDYSNGVSDREIQYMGEQIAACHKTLETRAGAGSDFLGWMELPDPYDKKALGEVKAAAQRIREEVEVLVVVGIGGSYLGARAAIEMLSPAFSAGIGADGLTVLFAGNNISSTYLADLLDVIAEREVAINVVSKSGTTTEPALAFRFLREFMEKRYGREKAAQRIYATTDRVKGALRQLADEEGYQTFVIPDNVGGRYSVLTPVGLLPIAAKGIDVDAILQGASDARRHYATEAIEDNECYQYAAARNILHRKGKLIEILVNYEPAHLHYFAEWWKQLFGESEGKDRKGIFPAACDFSTDLHSMGQYIQEGRRHIFETVLAVDKPRRDLTIPGDENNLDGLNYLAGKTVDFVNQRALEGTVLAHTDGGVPNLLLQIPALDAYNFGQLVYFFEKACAVSGYLLGVNPFDQPGVEAYKQNMFALLGRPGYEEKRQELEARLRQD